MFSGSEISAQTYPVDFAAFEEAAQQIQGTALIFWQCPVEIGLMQEFLFNVLQTSGHQLGHQAVRAAGGHQIDV